MLSERQSRIRRSVPFIVAALVFVPFGAADVLSGIANTADGDDATVAGGIDNHADGEAAFVGGGACNRASGDGSTVGGGGTYFFVLVACHPQNIASGHFSSILGGLYNRASGSESSIGGGFQNEARAVGTTIGGGYNNDATQDMATVAGGEWNVASGSGSSIGGGRCNEATGDQSTVAGGGAYIGQTGNCLLHGNKAQGFASAVSGGRANLAGGDSAAVSGGQFNQATGAFAVVGGGLCNAATGVAATVAGGAGGTNNEGCINGNLAQGDGSFIGGGTDNDARGAFSVIGGGDSNTAFDHGNVIGGGERNVAGTEYATVAGGERNSAGFYSFVGGGDHNQASSNSVVSGGRQNTADGFFSTVGGGEYNEATGFDSVVAGGENNRATGYATAVGGGANNHAKAWESTIPGGVGAMTRTRGQWAIADGMFRSGEDNLVVPGSAQHSVYTGRSVIGPDSDERRIHFDSAGLTPLRGIIIPEGAAWAVDAFIVVRDTLGNTAVYDFEGALENGRFGPRWVGLRADAMQTVGADPLANGYRVSPIVYTEGGVDYMTFQTRFTDLLQVDTYWVATVETTELIVPDLFPEWRILDTLEGIPASAGDAPGLVGDEAAATVGSIQDDLDLLATAAGPVGAIGIS